MIVMTGPVTFFISAFKVRLARRGGVGGDVMVTLDEGDIRSSEQNVVYR